MKCVNEIITAHKLNEFGFRISDEWVGIFLLAGLSDEYRAMTMDTESSGMPMSESSVLLDTFSCMRTTALEKSINYTECKREIL